MKKIIFFAILSLYCSGSWAMDAKHTSSKMVKIAFENRTPKKLFIKYLSASGLIVLELPPANPDTPQPAARVCRLALLSSQRDTSIPSDTFHATFSIFQKRRLLSDKEQGRLTIDETSRKIHDTELDTLETQTILHVGEYSLNLFKKSVLLETANFQYTVILDGDNFKKSKVVVEEVKPSE